MTAMDQVELEADEHTVLLDKALIVHQLRLEGYTYREIATRLGVSDEVAAKLHVEHVDRLRALEGIGAAEAARRVQDDRYEALLQAVWTDALAGDLAAVKECRAILDSITAREAKVTAMVTKSTGAGTATLIAEGATEAYIEALRRL